LTVGVELFTALVGELPTIIEQILAVLPTIIDEVINTLITLIPLIIDAGIRVFVALVEALPQIIQAIVAAVPKIIESIVGKTAELIPVIIDAGVKLFIALIQNLPTIIKEIVKAVPQIIKGLVTAFTNAIPQIVEVGKNLIMGIWEGIKSMAGWLGDKISGFIGDIKDWFTGGDGFDTHSPSKWAKNVIGRQIPAGVGVGITDNAKAVTDSVSSLMDKAYAAADANQAVFSQRYVPGSSTTTTNNNNTEGDVNIYMENKAPINSEVDMRRLGRAMGTAFAKSRRLKGGLAPA
jgi:phage-related protein